MLNYTSRTFTRWLLAILAVLILLPAALAQQQPPAPPPALPPVVQPGDVAAGAKTLLPPQEKAAIIRLHGEVDDMMRKSLERRLDIARKAGCTVVIYDINTYGGLITSGLEISKLTKRLPTESRLETVAWVHDKAYSAGIFIASSCQHIVMSSHSTMGDCVPIAINPITGAIIPLNPAEREKGEAPILNELEDSARQNHLDKALLWAMVVPKIEIHEMRDNDTGAARFVDTPEKNRLLLPVPDAAGGKKESPWRYVTTIDTDEQVLTPGPADAIRMGLSQATISSEQELRAALNIRGEVIALDFSWAEVATVWLTLWPVRFMLFVSMLVLAWIEFSHPGVSVPGIAAVICLVLLVGAPFLTGIAQVWEIVLIVLGLGIIVTDLVVFGGIGLLAVPGFILMAVGLVASFVPAEPGGGFSMPSTWKALQHGMMVVVFGSVLAIAAFAFLSRYLYITPGFRRLQLAPTTGNPSAASATLRDAADRPANDAVFIGALGKAATDLRPAGKARFGDHLVDVVSFGSFIERNSEVEVLEVSGNHIVVKPRAAPTPANTPTA